MPLRRALGCGAIAAHAARKWLARQSKSNMRDAILFVEELWNWVGRLEDAVRSGQGARLHDEHGGGQCEQHERGAGRGAAYISRALSAGRTGW